MVDQCPSLDAPAEFNDFSVQGMCEQGSITAVLAVAGFVLVIAFCLVLHKKTETVLIKKNDGKPLEEEGIEKIFKTTKEVDGKVLHTINEYLVLPFVSTDLKSFVMVIYVLWFALTIPMATTRLYKKMWGHELLFQQGPFNVLANMLGCKGLDILAIAYTEEVDDTSPFEKIDPPPERNSPAELDPWFTFHLMNGLLWLTFGFIQMYWAHRGWSVSFIGLLSLMSWSPVSF